MIDIDWRNLRTLNGSQNNAFEELCCQLAYYERPKNSKFVRKGTPDAGVECFAILPDGTEWGWQAKYFLSIGNSQWSQLDDSVKTALEKHPNLVKYTICIPLDLPDARQEGKNSLLDKWNNRVKKWNAWALEAEMKVRFEYWGSYHFIERLSREEHRGKFLFWFGKEIFSKSWFENRIQESISVAGPRYTPEIHVELPNVAQLFDSLGRTQEFFVHIKHRIRDLKKSYSMINISRNDVDEELEKLANILETRTQKLIVEPLNIDNNFIEPIPWIRVKELTDQVLETAYDSLNRLRKLEEGDETYEYKSGRLRNPSAKDRYNYSINAIYQFISKTRSLGEFSQSLQAKLSNLPALLLSGEAGTGKTHLFCDIAENRIMMGLPTILLMGQRFSQNEIWSQILRQLGFPETNTRDDLLGALQSAAQANNSKALIMIDALNEGAGKTVWINELPAILQTLSQYPWISFAISVRSSYEQIVIADELIDKKLIRFEHPGFAEHEYQAARTFFDYYKIEQPSVPLFVPEFQNPLFLKLLCKGLYENNQSKFPFGLQGITAIFQLFVDAINKKLSTPEFCDFNPNRPIVWQAIERISESMANQNTDWLPIDQAEHVVNQLLPGRTYEISLYRHLISEGLLVENGHFLSQDEWIEVVQFAYEKFSDHLIVKHLLDKYLNADSSEQAFLPGQPLTEVVENKWRSQGLVDALCIQIPERTGKELFDVAPTTVKSYSVARGFFQSVVWRNPQSVTDSTTKHLNRIAGLWPNETDQLLNSLLTVTTIPEHPYNAKFLHKRLMKDEIAERDAWWSTFLHYQYDTQKAVDRLVDWAWSPGNKDHIDDEAILLCGIALGWFLTTSNRFLRDRATKALVNLFSQRLRVLIEVLEWFQEVNDPYVSERLYAVAYGCALRSTNDVHIGEIAQKVYEWVFQDSEPPVHILLRDYARGIIEYALYRGVNLDLEVARIRPPYKSEWPYIPSESEIERYKDEVWEENKGEEGRIQSHLYYSIMGGDFARYVIGTNTSNSNWLNVRINEPKWISPKDKMESFEESISESQRLHWEKLKTICADYNSYQHQIYISIIKSYSEFSEENTEKLIVEGNPEDKKDFVPSKQQVENVGASFRETLTSNQHALFDEIFSYLIGTHSNDPPRFDLSFCQRWIVTRVFELGWTSERFAWFDRNVDRFGYQKTNKPERIGKKYQWLAFHEFLARLSDNFQFRDPYPIDSEARQYDGPWQLSLRDIDPSCILRTTGRGNSWRETKYSWWFPTKYKEWDLTTPADEWMNIEFDLPDLKSVIEVTRPKDDSDWIGLGGFYHWGQPVQPEEDKAQVTRREIWFILNSYLVHVKNCEELLEWALEQDFSGRWLPEGIDFYRVYLGEFYWSNAYIHSTNPLEGTSGWQRGYLKSKAPKPILPLVDSYYQESEVYDCSIDNTISISAPTAIVSEKLGLSWNGSEGKYFDQAGRLIAYDPSVEDNGPRTLLFDKDSLLTFLSDNGYCVIWTVVGAKELIGGGYGHKNWQGELRINGAYRLQQDGQIDGNVRTDFLSPKDRG